MLTQLSTNQDPGEGIRDRSGGYIGGSQHHAPQKQRGQDHASRLSQARCCQRRARRPVEYVQKNVSLYKFRNGIPLTTAAAANFTRGELATALRKNPYSVNILMAGYDNESGASLYYIDYIATLHKVDKGAFGYGSYFSLSTMDWHYRSDMSVEEAIELVDKCILEIRSRLVVAPPNFVIKIVDKDGARDYAWLQDVTTAAV
ncbi:BnaCnng28610D [Brassica napus]|uniref:BnaCnng28610D protein n=1 Tax=Brassica napus TaxID=3708 RepID=A0A078IY44_BRANA|nr:BnaCnng28610D [Brassica napus]